MLLAMFFVSGWRPDALGTPVTASKPSLNGNAFKDLQLSDESLSSEQRALLTSRKTTEDNRQKKER